MVSNATSHPFSRPAGWRFVLKRMRQAVFVSVGRGERRGGRQSRAVAAFGPSRAGAALDLLELVELAWHDCYGDITPPEEVIDDILLVSKGSFEKLVSAALLAVQDWRDLKMAADRARNAR